MAEGSVRITGGCQCGAVRYALHAEPTEPHICHCRMCQKAFGSFFAPLVGVPREAFELTRGEMAVFRSSDIAERGFCSACGTPLSFAYVGRGRIAVSIGSLDHPERIAPAVQFGVESRMPWFDRLAALPGEPTGDDEGGALVEAIRKSSHQHPDHDTGAWPSEGP